MYVCMYVFIYDLLRWTFYNWERAWNNDKYMVPSWACKTQMIIINQSHITIVGNTRETGDIY